MVTTARSSTDTQLAQAITALTAVITNLQRQQQNEQNAQTNTTIMDPFASNQPFDLGSRAGSTAYAMASAPLETPWDGKTSTFPPFVLALKIKAQEYRWDADGPTGILMFTVGEGEHAQTKHLFDDYASIPETVLEIARATRTDNRAIQNSKTFYLCLKKSLSGDLLNTLFGQTGNLPNYKDGPLLFKKLTLFTMTSSLQLSIISYNAIIAFDPKDCGFNIPLINTKLSHLFVLSNTSSRRMSDLEKVQHLLTIYSRIKQPEEWAQWIRVQIDKFDDGTLVNYQAFMNAAAIKYTKIVTCSENGEFGGSNHTIQEDIVAILATAKRKQDHDGKPTRSGNKKVEHPIQEKRPPFVQHFKSSSTPNATAYKVGDTKTWNGETYHFCDCPTHRDKIRWHTHSADSCRTRKKWMESQGNRKVSANLAYSEDASATNSVDDKLQTQDEYMAPNDQVTALLAQALSLASHNETARDFIADALGSL